MKVKLIRDKLEPRGAGVAIHKVKGPIHHALLMAKLHEEASEIADAGGRDVDEMADSLQVLMDLAALNGIEWTDVEKACSWKHQERGGFLGGRVLIVEKKRC